MSGRPPIRRGFTLIEIAISLLLVSVAVLTIFMLIPSGIRTQTNVRYKIIASAKALEMIELLRGSHPSMVNDARDLDKEGIFPWDTRMCYKSMAPDMEAYLENLRGSLRPLPEAIGYRIDSEDDEIRRLLDAGGRLYYFFPNEPVGVLDEAGEFKRDKNWLSHSRKLIVGVVGHPQQNSVLYHPSVKVGPYHDFYPSPPTHGRQENSENWDSETRSDRTKQNMINYDALCRDPDIAQVMYADDTFDGGKHFGFWPFAEHVFRDNSAVRTANFDEAKRRAEGYLVAALWYANQQGIGNRILMSLDHVVKGEAFADRYADDWHKVLAMRYLAHAAAVLTSYFPDGLPDDGAPVGGDPEVDMVMGGITYWDDDWNPNEARDYGVFVTLANITAWHEASVRMAVLHGDRVGPYHWGASRPLNRQVMMDHPLVQLDIWSSPILGEFEFESTKSSTCDYPRGYSDSLGDNFPPLVANNVVTRRGWRACYPCSIVEPGLPRMFTGRTQDNNGDGTVDNRDPAETGDYYDYPPRILDTSNDGVLDENDNNVPTPDVTSTAKPVLPAPEGEGLDLEDLAYAYYEGNWNSLPNFGSLTPETTGSASVIDTSPREREERFGLIFTATIGVTTEGTYTFYTTSDDGSDLSIDGTQVVDNDGLHGAQERSGTEFLTAGDHALEVRFFEKTGDQTLSVAYEGPGISKTPLGGASGAGAWAEYRDDMQANGQPAVGPATHFTLAAPFAPQERCRQLVFWAVDWQAYEDFETHPSAAIDASRYPLVAPHSIKGDGDETAWEAGWAQRTDYQRQCNAHNAAALIIPSGRNPELVSCFRMPSLVDASGHGDFLGEPNPNRIPTVGEINTFGGWDESDYFRGNTAGQYGGGPQAPDARDTNQAANAPDAGGTNTYGAVGDATDNLGHDIELWNVMIFLGKYGVNRNGRLIDMAIDCDDPTDPLYPGRGKPSALVDVGPVPTSVRMRATTVIRFNFYDPRLSGSVRY